MCALVKSCNIYWVWSYACPGMMNILQDNKVPISLGRVKLFCLFVACSYTSMEATGLSCHFSWVCSCMPKPL